MGSYPAYFLGLGSDFLEILGGKVQGMKGKEEDGLSRAFRRESGGLFFFGDFLGKEGGWKRGGEGDGKRRMGRGEWERGLGGKG